jgi:hypothetical protein
MEPTTYYVWRRSDGYVAATTYPPRDQLNWSFEILLETDYWPRAREVIERERGS